MKRTSILVLAGLLLLLASCKSGDKKEEKEGHDHSAMKATKTPADSLEAAVIEGHDVGMAKYGKLKSMQKEMAMMLDSLGRLPGKAKEAASGLRAKAEEAAKELTNALNGMDKWMGEFNLDSARDNAEKRIQYLTGEKLKVDQVKEAILSSLARADSVMKAKLK